MRWVKLIGEKFGLIQEVFSYSFFALGAMLACFEVFSRYFFNSSHAWVEELVKLLIIYAVFISAGLTLLKGGHIGMDFLLEKFKGKYKEVIHLIINILTLVVSGLFFYGGCIVFMNYIERGVTSPTEIELPLAVNYLPIPIGFALLVIYCTVCIINNIINLRSGGQSIGSDFNSQGE
jgi:TRAP-type C4-dicarboxylate transport system permease small subunit